MTKEDFVNIINEVVVNDAARAVKKNLKSPPGRQPHNELLEKSNWYNNLDDATRKIVDDIIIYTSRATAFGFFTVLDQVSSIHDTIETPNYKRGKLELYYTTDTEKTFLNSDDNNLLHDIFRSLY